MNNQYDDEAIVIAAQEAGLSPESIRDAIDIYRRYERYHAQLKSWRKNAKIKAEQKAALDKEKAEHPEQCFCIEDGFPVQRWHEGEDGKLDVKDRIIRTFTAYGPYDFYHEHPYEKPVYACSRCGKEWIVEVAYA